MESLADARVHRANTLLHDIVRIAGQDDAAQTSH